MECLRTLEADIEIAEDGSLKLLSPLPAWLKPGRSHVLLAMADATVPLIRKSVPKATPEMLAARSEALAQLRSMGGLTTVIPDPAAW